MNVSNLTSAKGNKVANQFDIDDGDTSYFQSYSTMIARRDPDGSVTLDPKWDYSVTTMKYCKQWLNVSHTAKEIRALIEEGFYKLANLN